MLDFSRTSGHSGMVCGRTRPAMHASWGACSLVSSAACAHAGVSDDAPLARLWAGARTLRIADGPDDVHLISIAKLELAQRRSKL